MGLIVTFKATVDKLMAKVIKGPKPFPFEPDSRAEGASLKNVLSMDQNELMEAGVQAPLAEMTSSIHELVSAAHHPVIRNDRKPSSEPFFSHHKAIESWEHMSAPIYLHLCGSTLDYLNAAGRFHVDGLP
jgi:hypothetical protein